MFNVGDRIKKIRKLNNVTSTILSDKIGLTQPQLSRIENNINLAQLDTVEKICEIFNMSLSDFFATDLVGSTVLTNEQKSLLQTIRGLSTKQVELLISVANEFKK